MAMARGLPDGPAPPQNPNTYQVFNKNPQSYSGSIIIIINAPTIDPLYFSCSKCFAHPMATARALPDNLETPKTSNNDVDITIANLMYPY
eukprot:16445953-Heterocapsa_arctica.AAC.1